MLFRNTRIYGALAQELCDPACLREEERRRHLAKLERALLTPKDRARWRPLVRAEQRAVDELDIPLFRARADSVDLDLGDGSVIERCLSHPGAQCVMGRLRALGPRDMERQLGFVAGSLHANAAHRVEPRTSGRRAKTTVLLRRPDLERAALAIAAEMSDSAIRPPGDAGASRIAPQYLPHLDRYQLQPIGFDFHSGCCGIALFLAAVARATGSEEYARLALAAIHPLRQGIEATPVVLADELGLGAATGLGSVTYGLTRLAHLLDERALLDDASAIAALLTEERLAGAPLDVFGGLAGEILGQHALHSAAPDTTVLSRAVECGDRLLDARVPGVGGRLARITYKDRLLSGFSHGAAGIALRAPSVVRGHGARGVPRGGSRSDGARERALRRSRRQLARSA
ncbi:MAG: lanthionine synthetase LanC family protein [Gemmatimonadota bacterium]